MTVLALFGGPLKRNLILTAYEICGQAGYEFDITAEELDSGCRRLNGILADWLQNRGIDLGYNFPSTGNGTADEESGIPTGAFEAVSQTLARRIAPTIGKMLSPEAKADYRETLALLFSTYTVTPRMELGRQTPRGAGNRRVLGCSPYFRTTISDAETAQ